MSRNENEVRGEFKLTLARAEAEGNPAVIVPKMSSRLMKLISWILFWNRDFMTRYVTTVGGKIYVPQKYLAKDGSLEPTIASLALLRHELRHVRDRRRFGAVAWPVLYLFPLPLALLAFGAFWNIWFLAALVFLAPLPAPFRVWAEIRGYEESMRTFREFGTLNKGKAETSMKTIFTGSAYYWMSWRWAPIRRRFSSVIEFD